MKEESAVVADAARITRFRWPVSYPKLLSLFILSLLVACRSNEQPIKPNSSTRPASEAVRTVVQYGHTDCVSTVIFSPDGRTIASAGEDRRILLRRTSDGSLTAKILGHRAPVNSLAFHPGGQILASASSDQTIKLWTIQNTSLLRTLGGHGGAVWAVAFSPDGSVLASGSEDRTVKLWRVSDGSCIATLRGHSGLIKSLSFNSDGMLLASASLDRTVKLWNVHLLSLVRTIVGHQRGVYSALFSPDGQTLVTGSYDYSVKLWRVTDASLMRSYGQPPESERSLVLTTDLAAEAVFYGFALAVNPSGTAFAVARNDKTVELHNISDGSLMRSLPTNGLSLSLAFSPYGRTLAQGRWDNGVYLWNLASGSLDASLKTDTSNIESLAYSPDGAMIASSDANRTVTIWSVPPASVVKTIRSRELVKSMAFSRNGKILALADLGYMITLIALPEFTPLRKWKGGTLLSCMALNPAGSVLASSGMDKPLASSVLKDTIKLWAVPDGSLIRTLEGHPNEIVVSVVFSPDGSLLASSDSSQRIRIWQSSDGSLVASMGEQSKAAHLSTFRRDALAFSPDGTMLAARGRNGSVSIWRVSDWSLITTLSQLSREVTVAFSPDGKLLASGCVDSIFLWNTTDWSLARTLTGDFSSVYLTFRPDSRLLASGGTDRVVRLWRPKDGTLVATLFSYDSDSFVSVTPEGFFNGGGNFSKYINFVRGFEVYAFGQFYETFYRPDLVESKLIGEDLDWKSGGITVATALTKGPPEVRILSPADEFNTREQKIRVNVRVTDLGGEIGEKRLYHNGKLVHSTGIYRLAKGDGSGEQFRLASADTAKLYRTAKGVVLRRLMGHPDKHSFAEFRPQRGIIDDIYEISLVKGKNTVSACASNGDGTVMSPFETVTVFADIVSRTPNLFLLAIGNDHFVDGSYQLKLAGKDARDFSKKLKDVAAPLYSKIFIKTVLDAQKRELVETANLLSKDMVPEDVFVLYAASHGLALDDLYYLFFTDFDGTITPGNAISSVELMDISKRIPALKQVFVLDTCSAGGIGPAFSGLYDVKISVLAKAMGMHVLGAAKSYQDAMDDYKGNGLFTYWVLKALDGQADQNLDGVVGVAEMGPFLMKTVRKASRGRQEAFIRNFGTEFPIAKP